MSAGANDPGPHQKEYDCWVNAMQSDNPNISCGRSTYLATIGRPAYRRTPSGGGLEHADRRGGDLGPDPVTQGAAHRQFSLNQPEL